MSDTTYQRLFDLAVAAVGINATEMGNHPGGNPGANLKSISHRCFLLEVAFEWELTKETIYLPLGCLQGGARPNFIRKAFQFKKLLAMKFTTRIL